MKTLGIAFLGLTLLGGGLLLHDGVVVVDVREADDGRVVVPVPVAAGRAALALAPDGAKRIEAREAGRFVAHLPRVVDALRGSPDASLVEVHDGPDTVTVRKAGDALSVLAVDGGGSRAEILVPLEAIASVARVYDAGTGSFRTGELVAALGHAPRGDIVRVADGDQRVRIRRLF